MQLFDMIVVVPLRIIFLLSCLGFYVSAEDDATAKRGMLV